MEMFNICMKVAIDKEIRKRTLKRNVIKAAIGAGGAALSTLIKDDTIRTIALSITSVYGAKNIVEGIHNAIGIKRETEFLNDPFGHGKN
jgi:hypothetical protein